MADWNDELVGELIMRIQAYIFPRRIRVREFFVDFDPLRSGRCTVANFARALGMAGVSLSDEQVDLLAEHFTETGPRVQKPQVVNYVRLCQAVDEVFEAGGVGIPQLSSSPSSTQMMTFRPKDDYDEERLNHLLHRLAMLCKTRGVLLKGCYTDFDRAAVASPSRITRRRGGQVTRNQFIRMFPFKKEMEIEDIDFLAEHYTSDSGDVHFMALHNDISEVAHCEPPPFPRSDLFLRPDDTEWSHSRLNPVDKLKAKVVEKRVRMHEHFQDFDALRKGYCTVGQVKTVFTILNLGKEIDKLEFEHLVRKYVREDGMFCYRDFCLDVDQEFTRPHLEKEPLAEVRMPSPDSTAPARRNRAALDHARMEEVNHIEDMLRARISQRRMILKPAFKDMDKANRGHITRSQFARVMHMVGLEVNEAAVAALCGVYCDLGNHIDFNYVDFLKSVDPPSEEEILAMMQDFAPAEEPQNVTWVASKGTSATMGGSRRPKPLSA